MSDVLFAHKKTSSVSEKWNISAVPWFVLTQVVNKYRIEFAFFSVKIANQFSFAHNTVLRKTVDESMTNPERSISVCKPGYRFCVITVLEFQAT